MTDDDKLKMLISDIRTYRNNDRYIDHEYYAFRIARYCMELKVDELLQEEEIKQNASKRINTIQQHGVSSA